ncbi:MAG: NADH-quinone oxidoreductase subunit J [Fuerstiella sp.]|nr:NADH-quinone oxidoreductase subunit J [Fuerstiella sp.]
MNGDSLFFTLFAFMACLGAVAVVVSQRMVRMAFWLIISLGSTAALFFLIDADFLGAAQLLIYVGGTLVLLVFAVMLTSSGPYLNIETSPGEIVMAAMLGLLFLFMVVSSQTGIDWNGTNQQMAAANGMTGEISTFDSGSEGNTLRTIGMSLLGLRPDRGAAETGQLHTGYLLPFEIVSVHLLVVLIGAAYLARAKRRRDT